MNDLCVSVSAGSDQEMEWMFGPSVSAERGTCEQMEEKEEEVMKEGSCSRGDSSEGAVTRETNTLSSRLTHTHGAERCTLIAEPTLFSV